MQLETSDWRTLPNAITLLRLLLLAPVCVLVFLHPPGDPWPTILLVLWAGTDWVDGLLARKLGQVSRFGEMFDPIADRFGIAAIALTMAFAGLLSWWALAIMLAADVASMVFAGKAAVRGDTHVTKLGKVRMVLLCVAVVLIVWLASFAPEALWIGHALLWIALILHVVTAIDNIRLARLAQRSSP